MQFLQLHAGGEESLPFWHAGEGGRELQRLSVSSQKQLASFQQYKSDMDSQIDRIIKNNN